MRQLTVFTGFSVCLCSIIAFAQTSPQATSDAQAIALVQKSVTALMQSLSVSDVTLNADVISVLGSDNETGTGVLRAKGTSESRIDLNLSAGTRSDIRNVTKGFPAGIWETNGGNSVPYAEHNCWTDAAWFFPALSSLVETNSLNFIFKYIGQEQYNSLPVQHIEFFQTGLLGNVNLQALSTTDVYLDSTSFLPLDIKSFTHPDNDMNTNIPMEIRFANYQAVSGILVPFHVQELLNGGVVLDITVTSAAINTGIADAVFAIQ